MDYTRFIGMQPGLTTGGLDEWAAVQYINFKLAATGMPVYNNPEQPGQHRKAFIDMAEGFFNDYQEKERLLAEHLCPADQVLQDFLDIFLADVPNRPKTTLPGRTFVLDQHGLARVLSLPPHSNQFKNKYISSYRIKQGVLQNPTNDRRTTSGTFHVAEGGFPIPADKLAVPRPVFANLLWHALNPPKEVLELPFTSDQKQKAHLFVSLLMRPIVSPKVNGVMPAKSMQIRFFAPGSCVSSLDFVESIFGNAGNPYLAKNNALLDTEGFSGHTGGIIVAPHLTTFTKKELGLPSWEEATVKQQQQGMCWRQENELYNSGKAFKITARDQSGVIFTIIADNYFGYSKKEVKTQISFAANLMGLVEEEHAGGAVAFPRYNLGEVFYGELLQKEHPHTFEDTKRLLGDRLDVQPLFYAIDKQQPELVYIHEKARIDLYNEKVWWELNHTQYSIRLLPGKFYIHPSGYSVHMEKHPTSPNWSLVGTFPLGTFCHKPFTVSGGGKSEISKSLHNSIIYNTLYVNSFKDDLDLAEEIISHDYRHRWRDNPNRTEESRPILSESRTLGSVIKLLTPSPLYTDEHNDYVNGIPFHVKALVLYVKRYYRPQWGEQWRKNFSVDIVNGRPGHQLMFNDRKIIASYLRIGFDTESSWRIHKLRADFHPAMKIQLEDDITASITLPAEQVPAISRPGLHKSVKVVQNCEYRFFQRPDDAIHRGFDKQAEYDMSGNNLFICNYQPLTPQDAREMRDLAIEFEQFTKPIKDLVLNNVDADPDSFFVSPSHPRVLDDGSRSKNVRYLQDRPDFTRPLDYYLAEIQTRLHRSIPLDTPLNWSVDAILPGRRNNPPDYKNKIRPLSVYSPIHYQELPELFMDVIASLSGKSPSTTGAGSEGALTKAPFNALPPVYDLNAALLSFILTGYAGFSTAAGWVGTKTRFDHDITMLVPELWCRLTPEKFDPRMLTVIGALEKVEDYRHKGETIPASRLGYRITENFVYRYFGKIFDEPEQVFTPEVLRPELQDADAFADGVKNIAEAQRKAAAFYFEDNSVEDAIPPLKALLHIMVHGHYKNLTAADDELRAMFERKEVMQSSWYMARLQARQQQDIAHWQKKIDYLDNYIKNPANQEQVDKLNLNNRLDTAKQELARVTTIEYLQSLTGTIGVQVFKN